MSVQAFALLCELVEFPASIHYADCICRRVLNELRDRQLVQLLGLRIVLTAHGLREYWLIN